MRTFYVYPYCTELVDEGAIKRMSELTEIVVAETMVEAIEEYHRRVPKQKYQPCWVVARQSSNSITLDMARVMVNQTMLDAKAKLAGGSNGLFR